MKWYLMLVVLLPLSACKKSALNEQQIHYFDVWQQLHMKRNGMTKEYFHNHIKFENIEMYTFPPGEENQYCRVDYTFTVDYASVKLNDKFMIWKSSKDPLFPAFVVPKDQYLDVKSIDYLIETRTNYSDMNVISPVTALFYKSKEKAKKAMSEKSSKLKFAGYSLRGRRNTTDNLGHLMMEFFQEVSHKDNICRQGQLDLQTGEITVMETACWFE
jgi:hypothetical protein